MKTYLNVGCGFRFHPSWTNLDFISTGEEVIAHNLLSGIPFPDNSFEVVYHSHVLEHFTKKDAHAFLKECYRVLQKNGILRIAVPDLEQIAREYIKYLEKSLTGDAQAQANYDWILLEMYDQAVRHKSGGEMANYLLQPQIPNEDYVFDRLGEEGIEIRSNYLKSLTNVPHVVKEVEKNIPNKVPKDAIKSLLRPLKNWLKNILFAQEIKYFEEQHTLLALQQHFTSIGQFRLSGEIHQWMYDRYSLPKLLTDIGFHSIEIKTAFSSQIPNWETYELESKKGRIKKPDSLFIEAKKR
jgi:hypothetical protein